MNRERLPFMSQFLFGLVTWSCVATLTTAEPGQRSNTQPPSAVTKAQDVKEPPTEWTDPDTGHRVLRLSREPGSSSLYFHQNAYSADGQKLVITTPSGIAAINLKTRAIENIAPSRSILVTGRKTGQVYYNRAGIIYATDLNTKE